MAESPGAGTREVSWDAVGFAWYCPTQPWLKAERARGVGDGPRDGPADSWEDGARSLTVRLLVLLFLASAE